MAALVIYLWAGVFANLLKLALKLWPITLLFVGWNAIQVGLNYDKWVAENQAQATQQYLAQQKQAEAQQRRDEKAWADAGYRH